MFEAKLAEGHILKKIIESIKDLVQDVNLDVTPSGKCEADPRNFSSSHGHLARGPSLFEFEHGGLRVLPLRLQRDPGHQHPQPR